MQLRFDAYAKWIIVTMALAVLAGCRSTYNIKITCESTIESHGQVNPLVRVDVVSLASSDFGALWRDLGAATAPSKKDTNAATMIEPCKWFHHGVKTKVSDHLGPNPDRQDRIREFNVTGGFEDAFKLKLPNSSGKSAAIIVFADFHGDATGDSNACFPKCNAKRQFLKTSRSGRNVEIHVSKNDVSID